MTDETGAGGGVSGYRGERVARLEAPPASVPTSFTCKVGVSDGGGLTGWSV